MAGKSCSASLHMLGMSMELCEMLKVEKKKKKVLTSFRCFFVGLEIFCLLENIVTLFIQQLFLMGFPAKPYVYEYF